VKAGAPNESLHWTGSSRFSSFQCGRRWRLLPASELYVSRARPMTREHLVLLGAALVVSSPLITWFVFNRLNGERTYWVQIQGPRPLVAVFGGHGSPPSWVLGSSASRPEWLSQEDLDHIRGAIRHDMWHKAFSSVSWHTLREAPHLLCLLATCRVQEVELLPGEELEVRTRSPFGDYFFVLAKRRPPVLSSFGFGAPAHPKQQPVLTEPAFAESLSNHATLRFGH